MSALCTHSRVQAQCCTLALEGLQRLAAGPTTGSAPSTPAATSSSRHMSTQTSSVAAFTEADVGAEAGPPQRVPRLRDQHFYHRRHQAFKKLEKRQRRQQYLELAATEQIAPTRGVDAQREAEWHSREWLQRNLPVMPPPHASVAAVSGGSDAPKTAHYSAEDLQASWTTGHHKDARPLEVLSLKVGYSRDAEYALPEEVKAFILDQTTFCLYGLDKNQVSQIAANIRRIRPPEPYKGRGIRIVGESVKTKDRKVK